ncbi:MAG: GTP-binding protein [Saprospiraceae bacterium]
MNTTRLILVSGFLGAGKTSLLFETTNLLMKQGKRVGLITNDQAPELVDTALLLLTNVEVAEVSGSCFCCNFDGFIKSIHKINSEHQADIILAEPVGSCTDLSATIMQPLKEHQSRDLLLSPLTVLADPNKLADILDGGTAGLHPDAAYIFSKQLEEADIILASKSDVLEPAEMEILIAKTKSQFPDAIVLSISSQTGEGLQEWLSLVLESTEAGNRIIEVDYDKYAHGEALMGWLNSIVLLEGDAINWDDFAKNFLIELGKKVDEMGIPVGHIKIMLEAGIHFVAGNLTGNLSTLSLRGFAGISNDARLIINARAGTSPRTLELLVKESLYAVSKNSVKLKIKASRALSPGYPTPTYRYDRVID